MEEEIVETMAEEASAPPVAETGDAGVDEWRRRALLAERAIYERELEAALCEALGEYEFSSKAARAYVMSRAQMAGLKVSCGELEGLGELLAEIMADDPDAFSAKERAHFTSEASDDDAEPLTKASIMSIRERGERRAAIAANRNLFGI